MKVKVSELIGAALDWAVAKAAENLYPKGDVRLLDGRLFTIEPGDHERTDTWRNYNPTQNWQLGGPILTFERISRTIDHSGQWIAYWTDGYTEGDEGLKWMHCDRSELVAGLRCYVASKLGDEVEVPDELVQ